MSLILDALRKSEAERQRGTSPGLFAGQPALSPPRRSGLERHWPWIIASFLLLGGAIALWATRQDHGAERGPTISREVKQDDAAPEIQSGGSVEPTPVAPLLEEMAPEAGINAGDSNAAVTVPATPVEADTASAESATRAKPAIAASQERTVEQISRPAIQAPAVPTPSASPVPPQPEETQVDSLPPITVLAASERSSLPPLKLSMHVWNSNPGSRFAIIDGQRISEGSVIGSAVVEEIRRDGVVLNIDGRRILLPRP